jgi:hypothetical protein
MRPLQVHTVTISNGTAVTSALAQPSMRVVGVRFPATMTSTTFWMEVQYLPADGATWYKVEFVNLDTADTLIANHEISLLTTTVTMLPQPVQAYKVRVQTGANEGGARTLLLITER